LKYKYHLSYLLGQELIKSNRTWYKGGLVKFLFRVKKIKNTFKKIKDFKDFAIQNNASVALENLQNDPKFLELIDTQAKEIKTLLKTFENYEPLKNVLFQNLNFVFRNYEEIKAWLSSQEFKEKYQIPNHPYPPLLNPNAIDYSKFSADLAWDLNLPLMHNYKFIFCLIHGAGTSAMTTFFRLCGVNLNRHYGNADYQYKDAYKMLLENQDSSNGVIISGSNFDGYREKMIALCDKACPIFCVLRDPICLLLPLVNHISGSPTGRILREFSLATPMQELFDFELSRRKASLKDQLAYHCDKEKDKEGNCYLNAFLAQATKVICISMEEILPKNAFKTLENLAQELKFNPPKNLKAFEQYRNSNGLYLGFILFNRTFKHQNVKIQLSTERENDENFVECIRSFTKDDFIINKNKARVYIPKKDFEFLQENKKLFKQISSYLKEYFVKCQEKFKQDSNNLFKEEDVLGAFTQDEDLALKFKEKIQSQYRFIKENYPQIFDSWKFYKKFEQIIKTKGIQ